jgi:hypothetical protein
MRSVCAALLCAISLAGCSRTTPASPTAPVPSSPLPPADQITSVAVLGGQWVVLGGAPLQMTAHINVRTSADAPTTVIEDTDHVTWSADPPGVLSIDSHGRATAIASGAARVIATVSDRSGSSPIVRAVPEYSGTWSGNYTLDACSGAPDPRTCPRMIISQTDGSRILYPFALTVSQLQDQVTATLRETSPTFSRETPLRGFVRVSGELVLEGFIQLPEHETFSIYNWSSNLDAANRAMSGAFSRIEPTHTTFANYTLRTEHEFSGVTRTP